MHALCHIYNAERGLKDCSRSDTYHNKVFKQTAEAHGLNVKYDGKSGWGETSLTPKTAEFISSLGLPGFDLFQEPEERKVRKTQSSRTFVCPVCKKTTCSKDDIHITCNDCEVPFLLKKDTDNKSQNCKSIKLSA